MKIEIYLDDMIYDESFGDDIPVDQNEMRVAKIIKEKLSELEPSKMSVYVYTKPKTRFQKFVALLRGSQY